MIDYSKKTLQEVANEKGISIDSMRMINQLNKLYMEKCFKLIDVSLPKTNTNADFRAGALWLASGLIAAFPVLEEGSENDEEIHDLQAGCSKNN